MTEFLAHYCSYHGATAAAAAAAAFSTNASPSSPLPLPLHTPVASRRANTFEHDGLLHGPDSAAAATAAAANVAAAAATSVFVRGLIQDCSGQTMQVGVLAHIIFRSATAYSRHSLSSPRLASLGCGPAAAACCFSPLHLEAAAAAAAAPMRVACCAPWSTASSATTLPPP